MFRSTYRILALLFILILFVACSPGDMVDLPAILGPTDPPPPIPSDPALTATGSAAGDVSEDDSARIERQPISVDPDGYPTLTPGPDDPQFAGDGSGDSGTDSGGGGTNGGEGDGVNRPGPLLPDGLAPTNVYVPAGNNLFANPSFEGAGRAVDSEHVVVADEWQPFYCAEPYTQKNCPSAYQGTVNPPDLEMTRPSYILTNAAVSGGGAAQQWWCSYTVCRGGVYQKVKTQPGQTCTVSARVRVWSAPEDTGTIGPGTSDTNSDDARNNAVWYIRVDPHGAEDPWAGQVQVSPAYGYEYGFYDAYSTISMTFTARSSRATIFFENTRLWPFKNNVSFIDDAVVVCEGTPDDAADTDVSPGIRIGDMQRIYAQSGWRGISLLDIMWVGDELWMYYREDGAYWLATSMDGAEWETYSEPLLEARPERWDANLFGAAIARDADGTFHMWYVGQTIATDNYSFSIGYASSENGRDWRRVQSAPVLTHGAPGAWNEERIGLGDVIQVGGRFYLFQDGTTLQPRLTRHIGCWVSSDGLNWDECSGNPVISPREDEAPMEGHETEQPNVVYKNGQWVMAYTGYDGPQGPNFRVFLSRSPNGLDWKRSGTQPVIEGNSPRDPVIFWDQDDFLWLIVVDGDDLLVYRAPITYQNQ